MKEYDLQLNPTGKSIHLIKNGEVVAIHPSGLSFHPQWGALLSDTWQRKGVFHQLDWKTALTEGNLDHALKKTIVDDAAVNGSRGVFVNVGGKILIATSDYGDITPQLRFYDP